MYSNHDSRMAPESFDMTHKINYMVIGMDPGNIVNVYAVTFGKDRWRPYMEAYEMYYN